MAAPPRSARVQSCICFQRDVTGTVSCTQSHVRECFWAHCRVVLQRADQISGGSCDPLAAAEQAPSVVIPHDEAWHEGVTYV